jgi:CRISPR system Cascade subunit CasA
MNLLLDKWIPIERNNAAEKISLQDLLCGKYEDLTDIKFSRDDFAFAALQLIICICQSVLIPKDEEELKKRISAPMPPEEYQTAIKPYIDCFDLFHEKYPFMQTMTNDEIEKKIENKLEGKKNKSEEIKKKTLEKESTPIQKLLPGLPVGDNSHIFFNSEQEIEAICQSCAAIALFNQASNAPSFGGGFKNGIRVQVAITVFVKDNTLRKTVWQNIVPSNFKDLPDVKDKEPVWIKSIIEGSYINSQDIGLLKGLFWQPLKIKLLPSFEKEDICPLCGIKSNKFVDTYISDKFTFDVKGYWDHPHSSKLYDSKKKEWRAVAFNNSNPGWTYLPGILYGLTLETDNKIVEQATTIRHYIGNNQRQAINLIIGGYKNKQAKIENRRHELIPISAQWT